MKAYKTFAALTLTVAIGAGTYSYYKSGEAPRKSVAGPVDEATAAVLKQADEVLAVVERDKEWLNHTVSPAVAAENEDEKILDDEQKSELAKVSEEVEAANAEMKNLDEEYQYLQERIKNGEKTEELAKAEQEYFERQARIAENLENSLN